jgi:hypothetical protein
MEAFFLKWLWSNRFILHFCQLNYGIFSVAVPDDKRDIISILILAHKNNESATAIFCSLVFYSLVLAVAQNRKFLGYALLFMPWDLDILLKKNVMYVN